MTVEKIDTDSDSLTLKRIFDSIDQEIAQALHFVDQIMNSMIKGGDIKSSEKSIKKRFFK